MITITLHRSIQRHLLGLVPFFCAGCVHRQHDKKLLLPLVLNNILQFNLVFRRINNSAAISRIRARDRGSTASLLSVHLIK